MLESYHLVLIYVILAIEDEQPCAECLKNLVLIVMTIANEEFLNLVFLIIVPLDIKS